MSNTSAIVKLWGLDIGAVLWDENSELAAFEYTPEFIATGIEVAPLKMPAAPGIKRFPASVATPSPACPACSPIHCLTNSATR